MGAGGVLMAPSGYHKKALEICKKYDVKYISDEVVTAFCRLGHFFQNSFPLLAHARKNFPFP